MEGRDIQPLNALCSQKAGNAQRPTSNVQRRKPIPHSAFCILHFRFMQRKSERRAKRCSFAAQLRGALLLVMLISGVVAAAALGLSLAAVKSRLHRARLRLAAELRRNGPC